MKRLWTVLLSALVLLLLSGHAVLAEPDEEGEEEAESVSISAEDLADQGWEEREETDYGLLVNASVNELWCKTSTDLTEDDYDMLPAEEEDLDGKIESTIAVLERHDSITLGLTDSDGIEEEGDWAMLCLNLEVEEEEGADYFCVGPHLDLHTGPILSLGRVDTTSCWDSYSTFSPNLVETLNQGFEEVRENVVPTPLQDFVTTLNQGFRWFLAMVLYWWILVPHAHVEDSPAQVLWPAALGLGILFGIFLMIWQGVKMMFSRAAPEILINVLKGLGYFFLWCAIGIAVVSGLGRASEALTAGILSLAGQEAASLGCTGFQAQPDGLELDLPEMESADPELADNALAFASCTAAQFAFITPAFLGFMAVLYVLAFIFSFIQALLLFLREAALPIMALLIPIAAAGQIGGTNAKRWLPNLLAMILTLLAYKPMIATIFAVGFTTATMENSIIDVIRGLLTLLIGVVAPGVLLKGFKAITPQAVEGMAGLGASANNIFMATQLGGQASQLAERVSGASAARRAAATRAAHQGGGMAVTATKAASKLPAGPSGWVAAAGQMAAGVVKGAAKGGGSHAFGEAAHAGSATEAAGRRNPQGAGHAPLHGQGEQANIHPGSQHSAGAGAAHSVPPRQQGTAPGGPASPRPGGLPEQQPGPVLREPGGYGYGSPPPPPEAHSSPGMPAPEAPPAHTGGYEPPAGGPPPVPIPGAGDPYIPGPPPADGPETGPPASPASRISDPPALQTPPDQQQEDPKS